MRLVEGHDRISRRPGQNVARKRVWGDFATGGSRGIRESHEYVRKGGAAAREMLMQAAANEWKVPAVRSARAANSVITHKPSGRTHDLRQGRRSRRQARAAEGRQAQGSEGLEDRRQAAQAARHRRQGDRQADLRHRRQAAGHAQRGDQGVPGVRRQGEELRRRQGHGHAGRQEGRAGRRCRRRGGGRHLVAGQDRARRAADRLGRRPERQGLERVASPRWLKAGLDAERGVRRQSRAATPRHAIAGAAKKVEAVYAYPYQNHAAMEPMNATALYTRGQVRGLDRARRTARPRSRAAVQASGLPADKCDVLQDAARRRLRPARHAATT